MRGQTAVEYLMTYGWAILIILIVAGVLAYYGIFAPTGFLGSSARGFTTVMVLQPWSLSSGGVFTANLENRVGEEINVTNVYIWTGTTGDSGALSPEVTFSPGEKDIVTFATTTMTGTAGDTFQYSVAIEYELTSTPGTYFNSTGSVSGTFS